MVHGSGGCVIEPYIRKLENLCMQWPNCVMEKNQKKDYIVHIHAFTY